MSSKKKQTPTVSTYYAGIHFILCHGPIDYVTQVLVDDREAWVGKASDGTININKPNLFGGPDREGGIVGDVDLAFGTTTQTANTYLVSKLGANIPAFRGVVSAILKKVLLGNNYYLKTWAFKVSRIHTRKNGIAQWQNSYAEVPSDISGFIYSLTRVNTVATCTLYIVSTMQVGDTVTISGAANSVFNGTKTVTGVSIVSPEGGQSYTTFTFTVSNAGTTTEVNAVTMLHNNSGLINAVHVIRDCLTDYSFGMGYNEALPNEASFLAAAQTCYNEGLGFAFTWEEVTPITDFIDQVLKHINGVIYMDRVTGEIYINLIRKLTSTAGLLELNETNIAKVSSFKRKTIGELTSTVTVKFLNNATNKSDSTQVSELSLIQRQSNSVTKNIEYKGVATLDVAQKLAVRDLRTYSIPTYACSLECNREAETLNIGDAFILNWPDFYPTGLTMRVNSVNLGSPTSGKIVIEAIQDIFEISDIVYSVGPTSAWINPINQPKAPTNRLFQELPYYLYAINEGDSAAQAVLTTNTFVAIAAGKPSSDAIAANIWTTTGATFTKRGSTDFCCYTTIVNAIDKLATSITVTDITNIDLITVGYFIQIDSEILGVTAITGSVLTVTRGLLDTVPANHAAGAGLFAWEDFYDTDMVTYVVGEIPKCKLTTLTPAGELALASAIQDTVTTVGRMHMPYPPGNLKIQGSSWPNAVVATAMPSGYNDVTYDADFDKVVLLLQTEGFGATFVDKSLYARTLSTVGNTTFSTTQKRFGSSSIYFDGTGDYISCPDSNEFVFGTGDFTIEFWVNTTATKAYNMLVDKYSAGNTGWQIYIKSTGVLGFYTTSEIKAGSAVVNNGTWHHIAITRQGTNLDFWINGVKDGTTLTNSTNFTYKGTTFAVGAQVNSRNSSHDYAGYIEDLRITKGLARYTANFTSPAFSFIDHYYINTSLLLTGDGVNNGTIFNDLSYTPKTITAVGNVITSSAQVKSGQGSIYFDGVGDYLTIPSSVDFEFGSADFTIEVHFRSTVTISAITCLLERWNTYGIYLNIDATGKIYGGVQSSTFGLANITDITAISADIWYHVALVRSGNTLYLFKDGVSIGTTTFTGSIDALSEVMTIGRDSANSRYFTGYLENLRITKGIARYITNFTPQDSLTIGDYYNDQTTFMTPAEGTNNSKTLINYPSNIACTFAGNAVISTAQAKYGLSSMYFDGTGDYISYPSSANVQFGTGDFTVEAWVYIAANSNADGGTLRRGTICAAGVSTSNTNLWWLYIDGSSTTTGTGIVFECYIAGVAKAAAATVAISQTAWHHIAVVRQGSTVYIFLDGISQTVTNTLTNSNLAPTNSVSFIGGTTRTNYNRILNGYIDQLRITKAARYTANFTPTYYVIPSSAGSGTIIPFDLSLTWATRNRLQQTTSTFTDYYAGNVTTEASVTYSGELRKVSDNSLLASFSANAGTSQTLTAISYNGLVKLDVWSVRGTFSSWQKASHTFTISTGWITTESSVDITTENYVIIDI